MKRMLAMLLAVLMLVGLCACSGSDVPGNEGGGAYEDEVFMLFDKYDDIIYALENGEYTYAIQQIVQMSNQGREDLTSMDQIFQAEWYPEKDVDGEVPAKITVSEGGAIEIDGKAYTFLLEYSSSEQLWGWLLISSAPYVRSPLPSSWSRRASRSWPLFMSTACTPRP